MTISNYLTKSYTLFITDNNQSTSEVCYFSCLSHLFQYMDWIALKGGVKEKIEKAKKGILKNLTGFGFTTPTTVFFASQMERVVTNSNTPDNAPFEYKEDYDFTPYTLFDIYYTNIEWSHSSPDNVVMECEPDCTLAQTLEFLEAERREAKAGRREFECKQLIERVGKLEFKNNQIIEAIGSVFYWIKLK